ncbi:hypothetical protein R3P38DRAFT_2787104 [Favolaschia claudopus]|uniref:Protein N-terminal glutamine amidohydrolase alpha beta roll domain-containing protein n=1 Tax=Favolaschia claudopus TaxID=2862362 RepID=A0AAW0APW8_9AGAR
MKRFWKSATVDKRNGSWTVLLDNRPLKTPAGNILVLPPQKSLVATLVAAEWENQETLLKHHALPMTALASRAIDAMVDETNRSQVSQALLEYLDTDTICFHEDYPPQLVDLQAQHWDPLLSWARSTFDVELHMFNSLLSNSQPDKTKSRMNEILSTFDQWEMAGTATVMQWGLAMERATYSTKSFIIALALVKKHLSVEQAALAAQVEVASQIQRWGEVEDSGWSTFLSPSKLKRTMLRAPSPPQTAYTFSYCEENVYLLCAAFLLQGYDVLAVFISNEEKTVALWNQKLDTVVIWDYHVVLLLRSQEQHCWIYDFDTRLSLPCLAEGTTFLEHFASDRSHMLIDETECNTKQAAAGVYRSPPPLHPPIRGEKATVASNLMRSFVSMSPSEETFGEVHDLRAMRRMSS